jgi:peroxiredoxin
MRFIFFCLIIFCPIVLMAQQKVNYEIHCHLEHFTPGQKVYLLHFPNNGRVIYSLILKQGDFFFAGSTLISNEPEENYNESAARLFIDHSGKGINFNYIDQLLPKDMTTVYLESGLTEVQMVDSARHAIIVSHEVNDGHYTLDSIYNNYFKGLNAANAEVTKAGLSGNDYLAKINQNSRRLKEEQKRAEFLFIKTHTNSPVSLYILKHDEENYPSYKSLAPYFLALSDTLKNTVFGKQYGAMLERLKLVRKGVPAPDFTMNDTEGKPVALSSFKGKYVLIDFWASWCGPCRIQYPFLRQAYQDYKSLNFTILGVSLDKDVDRWRKAISDDGLNWTQVSDLAYWQNAAAQLYSVQAIPQNFLLDPEGKIIGRNLFGKKLEERLARVLSKSNNADKEDNE